MMPYCEYKRCKKVSDRSLGKIYTYDTKSKNVEITPTTIYLCTKHHAKILKLVGLKVGGDL